MTVSDDPRPGLEDWIAFVEHCVATTYLGSLHAWRPGTSAVDDLVDETWLSRNDWRVEGGAWTDGRSAPVSTWDDGGALAGSVEDFCGLDLGDGGPRIVLVVDDAGPTAYDEALRAVRSLSGR